MSTALVSHPACARHLAGIQHPEQPQRLSVIHDQLVAQGVFDFLRHEEAPRATRDQLERVHAAGHVRHCFDRVPDSGTVSVDPDTLMDAGTPEAAWRAAGSVVHATDLVLDGQVINAFCSVRPPGHHATRAKAMGFCFFNNVAAGAAHALEQRGMRRVAIVDFDAHYGNGTEDIFRDDPRVLYCSAHQRDLFPSPDAPGAPDRATHIELEPGARGAVLRQAVRDRWDPILDEFGPEMVFVSAGFDAHASDPMSDLAFHDDDFRWISEWVVDMSRRHAGGRLVSVLEGGYGLPSLGRCAALHVRALAGI